MASSSPSLHSYTPTLPESSCLDNPVAQIVSFLSSTYSSYTHIYTDGSHHFSPVSTSSAIYIPSLSLSLSWKLEDTHSIVTAELYAIYQALLFVFHNFTPQAVVIFTDSKSSLQILSRRSSSPFHFLYHLSHNILSSLSPANGWCIHFQWVPSHVGIEGNEMADQIASLAHSNTNITSIPLSYSDHSSLLKRASALAWNMDLAPFLYTSHLGLSRTDSSPAPWVHSSSRRMDTTLSRLRIGHTRLASHLHRLGMADRRQPLLPMVPLNPRNNFTFFALLPPLPTTTYPISYGTAQSGCEGI
jgi:ribonuclease HI